MEGLDSENYWGTLESILVLRLCLIHHLQSRLTRIELLLLPYFPSSFTILYVSQVSFNSILPFIFVQLHFYLSANFILVLLAVLACKPKHSPKQHFFARLPFEKLIFFPLATDFQCTGAKEKKCKAGFAHIIPESIQKRVASRTERLKLWPAVFLPDNQGYTYFPGDPRVDQSSTTLARAAILAHSLLHNDCIQY